jgi:hypothetical protein
MTGAIRRARTFGALLFLVVSAAAPAPAAAQAPAPGSAGATNEAPLTLSRTELERIRVALNQPATLKLDDRQLRFYLEVVAKQPQFSAPEFFKGFDLLNGPTKRGSPMSHQEFVNMVTPKELYSSGGITAVETLQFALTNWLSQSLLKKALEDVREAKTDREVQQIRERIDRELEALKSGASKTQ